MAIDIAQNYNTSPQIIRSSDNLLINADFRTPINQRAFASGALATGIYGIDRWKANGSSNITIGASLTINSGAVEQIIEDPQLNGIEVTISALGGTSTGTFDGQAFTVSSTASTTLTVGNTGNITCKLTAASSLTALKIEYGPNATPFQPRIIQEEENLCLRYFERVSVTSLLDTVAYIVRPNEMLATFLFSTKKRSMPTVTISNIFVFSNAGGSAETGFTMTVNSSSELSTRIKGEKTAHGLAVGSIFSLDSTSTINADAEL
jgi:hypothetical protein